MVPSVYSSDDRERTCTKYLSRSAIRNSMKRRKFLDYTGISLIILSAGCITDNTGGDSERENNTTHTTVQTDGRTDGYIRPDDTPTAGEELQCPEDGFTRHPSYYEEDKVEWGDMEQFSLRVSNTSFEYGDVATIYLFNTSDQLGGLGTEEKFHVERYTEVGWQDVRGVIGESDFDYTSMETGVSPGEGFEWSIELTEEGLVQTRSDQTPDLTVCPELLSGRYRFLYWGVTPIAVSFDLHR